MTKKQHLINAAIFWTLVGGVMSSVGLRWVYGGFGNPTVWLLLAIGLGLLKGEFALGKAAKKTIARVEALPERSAFYQVFSKGQWILVGSMMFLGMAIRHSGLDKQWRGLVLGVVGIALLWGSKNIWKQACR